MFEVKKKNGMFYWILKADNGQVIALSQTYTSEVAVYNAIASVRKYAPVAEIKEITA